MKVVGLLSGGKDSVYNLLHCIINDHEPIALATLAPPSGQDEMDSYMYQTVGNSGVDSIAKAIGLRLFQREIKGTAVNMTSEYGTRVGRRHHDTIGGGDENEDEDETEDLFRLLQTVQNEMPEVEGVSVGAIRSNYQRVRVEHVCQRLGLIPIAYLWERNQEELLHEMIHAGMNCILLKVAGAGLRVEHLGQSLKTMEETLLKLNRKFDLHVCGEGGEYETFTLDCPLFRQRIVLEETATIVANADPHSTVAHLRLDRCSLIDKPGFPLVETWIEKRDRIRKLVTIPPILTDNSTEILALLDEEFEAEEIDLSGLRLSDSVDSRSPISDPMLHQEGDWISFGEIVGVDATTEEITIEDEVRECFHRLENLLRTASVTLLSISHLNVYLSASSMSLFPSINAVYSTYFGTSPPTRACVAVILPGTARIKLEGIAQKEGRRGRKALHVQSLSYWAAANIGPYSQAVTVGERVFVAGQIPLIPSTLTLKEPKSFTFDVALSLQHVARVVDAAREGRWSGNFESAICWIADCDQLKWDRRVTIATRAWESDSKRKHVPVVFLSAATLPKEASIEWQVTYQTEIPDRTIMEAEVEDDEVDNTLRFERGVVEEGESRIEYALSTVPFGRDRAGYIACRGGPIKSMTGETLRSVCSRAYSVRAFYQPDRISITAVQELGRTLFGEEATVTVIGTDKIAIGETSESFEVVFVFFSVAAVVVAVV